MRKIILFIVFLCCSAQFAWADGFFSTPPKKNIGLSFSVSAWIIWE